jgi:membrane protease YdiL (CAAX protease family)
MPSHKREKRKLPLLELFYTFLVAEAFMTAGNLLGQTLTTSISTFLGIEINDATAQLIVDTPVWLIFILAVIIGPIVEEFIFRKLMIDKLSIFRDKTAIIVSAVAFGLFHGNIFQFFYAAFLGLLLGYLYCRSGKITYTIVFHSIVNFIGSVAVIPILKYQELLLEGAIPETGAELHEYLIATMAMGSYTVLQYAMIIPGIFIFFNAIKYRLINVSNTAEIRIPKGKTANAVILNVGAILFLALSIISFGASLFLG